MSRWAVFRDAIVASLAYHHRATAIGISGDVERLCDALSAVGVPLPTDWQPEWTGYVSLRWHDGKLSSSVKLTIVNDGMVIVSGDIAERPDRRSEGRFSLPPISVGNAARLASVLMPMVIGEHP